MFDLFKTGNILWCHGPKPEFEMDGDINDRFYIPARVLPLVNRESDLIILPSGNAELKEFFRFCKKLLGLRDEQVIWTSGKSYLLDDDIRKELMPILKRTVNKKLRIVPYSVTAPFLSWALGLPCEIVGDEESWTRKYSDKSIIHSHPKTGSKEILLEDIIGLKVAKGYTCSDKKELLSASNLLTEAGVKNGFVIKPAVGTTGEGIIFLNSTKELEKYHFPMGKVIIEERLIVDKDKNGRAIAPSVQFVGANLYEEIMDQEIRETAFEGNVCPSKAPQSLQREIFSMSKIVLEWMKPKGPGGFDFLSVNNKAYFTDPNVGRFTGAHPSRMFRDLYAHGKMFKSWKINPACDIWSFWKKVEDKNLAFYPGCSAGGIFPLCYLKNMWGMIIVIGDSHQSLDKVQKQAQKCL